MKIKIMTCPWNASLEEKELEVEKITSNTSTRVMLFQILKRLDKIEARLDNIVKKNNLKE